MQYAILCYDSEDVVCAWTKEQDEAAVTALDAVADDLARHRRLGPVARLMPTREAATIRKAKQPIVVDGPFAETKEQLLGFFIVECDSREQAIEAAKDLARASTSAGCFEVRPLRLLRL
jgi:hypothetical protein